MHQQQVPRTEIKPKSDKFWALVNNIILYLQLCSYGRQKLIVEKRMNAKMDFRLTTEQNLCMNLLLNVAGLSKALIMDAARGFVYDKESKMRSEFKEMLEDFCNKISPVRSTLITGPALAAELQKLAARGKR